jgi:Family of unknown function (DUF5989)
MATHSLVSEMWAYMRTRKRYWLLPVIVVMIGMSVLLVFAQTSVFAPFIYTVF